MRVVAQVDVEKNPGQRLAIEHGYEDARFDATWGFLGFRTHWSKNTDTGARTYTTYDMTLVEGRYPYRGMVKESLSFVKLDANCGLTCLPALWAISRTENTFDQKSVIGNQVTIPYVHINQTRNYEGPDYNGGSPDGVVPLTGQVTTTSVLDDYGNVTHTDTAWSRGVPMTGAVEFRDGVDIS
jgi:hypothetical protein